jgi:protein O-GlcNAc transferase
MDPGHLIQRAYGFHQQGQLDQAAGLYAQILEQDPRNFAALQLFGVLRGQQGRNVEAAKLIEAALKIQPRDFGTLANYAQVLTAGGRHQEALGFFERALAVKPDFFEALYNRGIALAQLKRFAEAVASYDKALALRPDNTNCFYNRGIALVALGRFEDALASYDQALARNPRLAEALDNRGNVLRDLGRFDQALDSYDKALALSPRDFHIHYNRAIALSDLNRFAEAIASYDAALLINSEFPEAWFNRGISEMALHRFTDALTSFDRGLALRADDVKALSDKAVALRHLGHSREALASCNQALARDADHIPTLMTRGLLLHEATHFANALADYDRVLRIDADHARAWNDRGATLNAMNRADEALASFEKAVSLKPDFAEALSNRAHLRWIRKGDFAGATSDLQAALTVDPNQPYARGELLHLKMYGADWTDFDSETAAIDNGVRQGKPIVRPFVYQALCQSPADLQACSRIFAASLFSMPAEKSIFSYRHEKIRIGYVSGEFREQATAYLMAGVYELHDRDRFEIIAIDNGGGDASSMRRRLEAAFDRIIYISHLSDSEAADRIRSEEIDILVNLNGYFGSPRMGIFARRAAPIQVNYLGFPATLGTACMDYILADKTVIPEDERCYYDEQVVYLPHSYQANDRKRPIAEHVPSRAALELPEQGFVFCNFNQSYKLTPSVFESWMRILRQTEASVLWLLKSKSPFEANLSQVAKRHGVAPSRLIFAPPIPPDQHLARLKQADLFLDTLPYNAHTTASDALWAGVPLLTCRGTAFPGRVAASLLGAVGMPDLVTETADDYESRAIALAHDPETLAKLKEKLARNRLVSPLFDTDLFRKDIESAYTAMWQTWKNGEPPQRFESKSAS